MALLKDLNSPPYTSKHTDGIQAVPEHSEYPQNFISAATTAYELPYTALAASDKAAGA